MSKVEDLRVFRHKGVFWRIDIFDTAAEVEEEVMQEGKMAAGFAGLGDTEAWPLEKPTDSTYSVHCRCHGDCGAGIQ